MASVNGRQGRLKSYLNRICQKLRNISRAKTFSIYVSGLIARLERKNGETIAAAATEIPGILSETSAMHQRLVHVIGQSAWSDELMRAEAERYAVAALPESEAIEQLIIDDTGWLKQGNHSVGVQRQYTGSAGKVTNCQVGVSVVAATRSRQLPVDFAIYLPEKWLTPKKRRQGKIPNEIQFQTKPEIALTLIGKAKSRGTVPICRVAADSAYGNSSEFRCTLLQEKYDIAVGVRGDTLAWSVDQNDHRRGPVTNISSISARMKFKRVSWREGIKGPLTGHFAARRVVPYRDYEDYERKQPLWLLAELETPQSGGDKYALITAPANANLQELVYIWKERYRTERAYQDLKVNCGLDHYQGRSFVGWNHHVSAVLVASAFIFSEQCRRPRKQGRQEAVRSPTRFDRHFPGSFATLQQDIASCLHEWLPALPLENQGSHFVAAS